MNRSRALLVFAVVLAVVVGQLSGANRAYANAADFVDLGAGLPDVYQSSVAWGDYDSDGNLDVLLTGTDHYGVLTSKIFENKADIDVDEPFADIDAGLTPVYQGSVAWGDYNLDNKPDILLTGAKNSGYVTELYTNDGDGTFSKVVNSGLTTDVSMSSVAWGDYNSDGRPDILLTGYNGSIAIAKVYRNNGDGTFTDIGADLTGVYFSSVAWGDYNSDGKPDILLTGSNGTGYVTKLYTNDGDGTFSEDTTAGLIGVARGSVAWGDYNSDGKPDILLTGESSTSGWVSKIYENNGDGTFSDIGAGLIGVNNGSASWGDYDSDGKPDVLLTGQDTASTRVATIYRNDGDDTFHEDVIASLAQVYYSSVAWGDYNSDGKSDIMLTGHTGSGAVGKIYENGRAEQNTAPSAPTDLSTSVGLTQATLSWSAATDTQQAGTPNGLTYNLRVGTTPGGSDVVSSMSRLSDGKRLVSQMGNVGEATSYTLTGLTTGATYYWSVQAVDASFAGSAFSSEGTFAIVFTDIGAGLPAVDHGSSAWGDYDSDGDLDVLITGFDGSDNIAEIWKNKDDGTFEEDTTADVNLTGVGNSSVAWGDYDSDGDLDILLTGDTGSDNSIVRIYENTNDGGEPATYTFTRDTPAEEGLTGVYLGSVAWGDYNSDGKPDILLTGKTAGAGGLLVSKIYKNDGDGTFSDIGAGLTGVHFSSVAWGDYNSDGKPDILLTGLSDSGRVSKIYRNDGNGTFTAIAAGLTDVYDGSVAWGDYDSDGDLDILLTGAGDSHNPIAEIWENNGDGTFDQNTVAGLAAVTNGSVAWGDYDADGNPDILLAGLSGSGLISKIYKNNGNGTFSDIKASLTGVYYSSAGWGDYNSDGRLDILLTGNANSGQFSGIYRNYTANANTPPTTPSSLSSSFASGVENLSWNAGSDTQTPAAALTYNLRVGTTPGGSEIVSPLSRSNGTRLLPRDGNVGEHTSYSLAGLAPDDYYWSVQTVDQSFAGSPFVVTEGTFNVPTPSFAFESSSYSVGEADGTATITITRAGSTAASGSVDFATSDGTATAGSDYTAHSETVSFAAGETSKTVSVPITNDSLVESNETVSLELSDALGASLDTPATATLTIVEDDRAVAFSSAAYSVNETGGTATVTINRTGSTAGTDSVDFAIAGGTATAGSDYTNASRTVTFTPSEVSKTVSIPITDDSSIEGDESVGLSLSNPVGATLGTPNTAALAIVDNDRTLVFSSATYSVSEAGGAAAVTINRSGLTSGGDSVTFATANGSATAGSDYTAVSTTVSFAAGEVQKTVSIPITEDSSVESSETVQLSLSSPSAPATLGSPSSATLTISDNDVAPPPSTGTTPDTGTTPTSSSGKIASCKLSKNSFPSSQAGKVKLTCKFSPKSKIFGYVLSLKKGTKWIVVKSAKKTGSFKTYTITVKKLFVGKAVKRGAYRLKLSADRNSKTLGFSVR